MKGTNIKREETTTKQRRQREQTGNEMP